ncbi:hypothetical protein TraAM80_04816 [Trypanosoma rangeli]|uniref:SET domain-containing protein n=1 Tax=Trypanosoma rangeli TaxID=5698 RepID=A0A3R7KBT0_TRYRA|nr:uncharacterized protein TraAM80_04816 [Trypanosoma rangeli]RNF04980.1 hypothetical protein TraAM80_04816 [Trypanosoma rangeli]|eukprot:RNF04980.1 hypothetical protein TraAM80_04816 [Trypanosoma rangeli]
MLWMEDTSRLVRRWEECLASARCDSVNLATEKETKERGQQRQTQAVVAEAAPIGMAALNLLSQIDGKGIEAATGDGAAHEGTEAVRLCQRLSEILVEAVLVIVESCAYWTGMTATVEAVCCELRAAASQAKEQKGLAEKLCSWWVREEIAEQGWRWCEVHLTLLPADESAWRYGASHEVTALTDWWWRPDAMSFVSPHPEHETTSAVARPLLKEVCATMAQRRIDDSSLTELSAATELLKALHASSRSLFSHRIAVSRGVLRRLFTVKATALLHQSHLLCCLALLRNTTKPCYQEVTKTKYGESNGHEFLWVSRECFSLAWRNLFAAITALQVATMHFNASCEDLRRQIRWALFGVKEVANHSECALIPSKGSFYVHPFVEPCENTCRVTHGVGFIAIGKVSEGSVILQEQPLLFVDAAHQNPTEPEMQNTAMSTVVALALELFRRGGITFKSDLVTSQVVESLQIGALFGEATQFGALWAALHLLAVMQPAGSDSGRSEESFACGISDLLHCWNERAIPLRSVEDFRIDPQTLSGEAKALYSFASFLNHSCSPNAIRTFSEEGVTCFPEGGGTLCVVALRDIEPGEEITVTYLPSLLCSREAKRQRNGFSCRCVFCLSYSALLEGVVCPACRQLIYDDLGHSEEASSVKSTDRARRRLAPYAHSPDCAYVGGSHYKELAENMTLGFRTALDKVHCELLENRGTDAVNKTGNCMQDGPGNTQGGRKEGEVREEVKEDGGDEKQYARRAQKAVRQLMKLDTLMSGFPTTHHYRLQARMECLATSLNASLTSHDTTQLLQLCEGLLVDLEMLLPRNYPLLTGIRLHYALVRSRHLIATTDINDPAADEYTSGCCGGMREQAEMMRLPFIQDNVIRECVVRSFQEHYVYTGWRFAEADERELLQSFLQRYRAELFACGVADCSHFYMLSLMSDAEEGVNM